MITKSDFANDLVSSFFKSLNENLTDYAVLRNYEGLPEKNISKDIDILFNPSEIDNTQTILMECASNLGYLLIWSNPLDYLKGFVFVCVVRAYLHTIRTNACDVRLHYCFRVNFVAFPFVVRTQCAYHTRHFVGV